MFLSDEFLCLKALTNSPLLPSDDPYLCLAALLCWLGPLRPSAQRLETCRHGEVSEPSQIKAQ
jgi:hypothetical protein